jgi:TetR/AcrR family transcriptional repressor of mexJK operon
VRAMVLSGKIVKSEKDLRERVTAAVRLFLDGCRDRPARHS